MNSRPRFTLIVATLGRTIELERFLRSLLQQGTRDFEVLIVDQNSDDRVGSLLNQLQLPYSYSRLRASRGLSLARNVGLQHARGEIVAFPDDDCWYPQNLLANVSSWFEQNSLQAFLLCSARDEQMQLSSARWPACSGPADRNNILGACISFGLFVRAEAAKHIGPFDEGLGLGAPTRYGSGEDTDYGLRLLESNYRGWYERSFYVHHPNRDPRQAILEFDRAFRYGCGFGQLLRKHHYTLFQVAALCLRALGGAVYCLMRWRPKGIPFYLASFAGRVYGYLF